MRVTQRYLFQKPSTSDFQLVVSLISQPRSLRAYRELSKKHAISQICNMGWSRIRFNLVFLILRLVLFQKEYFTCRGLCYPQGMLRILNAPIELISNQNIPHVNLHLKTTQRIPKGTPGTTNEVWIHWLVGTPHSDIWTVGDQYHCQHVWRFGIYKTMTMDSLGCGDLLT